VVFMAVLSARAPPPSPLASPLGVCALMAAIPPDFSSLGFPQYHGIPNTAIFERSIIICPCHESLPLRAARVYAKSKVFCRYPIAKHCASSRPEGWVPVSSWPMLIFCMRGLAPVAGSLATTRRGPHGATSELQKPTLHLWATLSFLWPRRAAIRPLMGSRCRSSATESASSTCRTPTSSTRSIAKRLRTVASVCSRASSISRRSRPAAAAQHGSRQGCGSVQRARGRACIEAESWRGSAGKVGAQQMGATATV
jgi:hypothetical protein